MQNWRICFAVFDSLFSKSLLGLNSFDEQDKNKLATRTDNVNDLTFFTVKFFDI